MKKNTCECPICSYRWVLRVEKPKECPRCKRRFDNWNGKPKLETKEFMGFDDRTAFKKELDKWNEEHPFS